MAKAKIGCPLLDSKNVGMTDTGVRFGSDSVVVFSDETIVKYCTGCRRKTCALDDLQGCGECKKVGTTL